jgi:hypothetical protein
MDDHIVAEDILNANFLILSDENMYDAHLELKFAVSL